ncbi:nuclear protein localization protein 4 homolog [Tribolium castaneum]|nr:PREDICTED: nuclear protein localization protein 4 homolog [Tribolium castaneum]XP_970927.1 PREDICTED: nuclear protein localization protein 4 homolog [Tribolium castaneum]|eukprot:XP_008196487.1 PREDICTED: nuclear protein localization protein 4 homolog [Tribolium castaneum]
MSKDKAILLRVQSPEGTKRIEVSASDSTCKLFERVHDSFDLSSFAFALYKERNQKNEIPSSKSRTVAGLGLRHGDMIYLCPLNGAVLFPTGNNTPSGEPVPREPTPSTSSGVSNSRPSSSVSLNFKQTVKEDPVDLQLYKLDGKIERKQDPKLCRHNSNSRCVHCSALEPYDEAYLREHNVKHLSFHAYLRKMTSGVDKGKFLALEDISCRIKNGCKDHPPWPKGICSKCQPNAITLNRQVYRHVDNVAFENKDLVERFLNYWRSTGHQRIGFLYGNYEIHNDVPLGIRANVVAIYEPPQESSRDSIHLLRDDKEEIVEELAQNLGLRRVGWIFTDLIPEDVQKGTVKHLRHINSHFLSAEECIMAGHFQNMYPNPCRFASGGYFGSKIVTVCVTGDKTNQVHMEGYQVSNQCMALVRDNCLLPTKDAPELGYVRESSDKQFVPDVYYKEKDNYGNEVSRLGRPLPVEYLLLDVPASTPVTPTYTFNCDPSKQPFPVENRFIDGEIQDFNALNQYLSQFTSNEFFTAINDFHLLLYIATMDMLPMKEYMGPLLHALRNRDAAAAEEWSRSEHWATIEQLIAASSPPPSRPGSVAGSVNVGAGSSSGVQAKWTCPHCTFLNTSDVSNCEMCSLPRSTSH